MATSGSGPSTLPFDFDIFVPPSCTQPWWKTLANGSRKPTQTHLVHDLHEEARVQEVPGGVVDAADVLVDGSPVVDDAPVERRGVVCGST